MRVYVTNRRDAEQHNNIDVPHKIISIHTPGDAPAKVKTNNRTRDVLHLEFHDTAPTRFAPELTGNVVLFDDTMVEKIVAFLNPVPEAILVHCDAGISRSAGVAAALARHFNGDDSQFWSPRGTYATPFRPNTFVYRKLLMRLDDPDHEVSDNASK